MALELCERTSAFGSHKLAGVSAWRAEALQLGKLGTRIA
jgi:hypothetical protein